MEAPPNPSQTEWRPRKQVSLMTPLRAINDCFKSNCTEEKIQDAKASWAPAKDINCSSTLLRITVCLFVFLQRTEERCSFKSQLVKCQHSHNRKLWQPHSRGSKTLSSSSSSVIENLSKKKCFFWILQYVGHVGMQGIQRIEKIFHWGYQVKNKSLAKMHCLMYTQFIEVHLIVSCVVLTYTGGCSLYHHGILITFWRKECLCVQGCLQGTGEPLGPAVTGRGSTLLVRANGAPVGTAKTWRTPRTLLQVEGLYETIGYVCCGGLRVINKSFYLTDRDDYPASTYSLTSWDASKYRWRLSENIQASL